MKYCKRMFLVLVAILATTTVTAQNITFRHGEKNNSKGYQPTLISLEKGMTNGHYYSIEPDLNAFSKVKGIMVREVDIDYKEFKKVVIENTNECGIMHIQRDGTKLHLVLSLIEKKKTVLRHVCVDLNSFTVVNDKVLVDIIENKGDEFYYWDGNSSSGNYYSLVYANVNEKKGTADVQAMLFDQGMNLQWKRQMPVASIAKVLTTNDGRIATCGYSNGEGKSDGANMTFSITDASGTKQSSIPSSNKLGEMALLNCFGNKILATALETDRGIGWAGNFTAGIAFTHGIVYTGCAAYLFDVADGRMVNTDRHTFTKEDARVFYNASMVTEITSPDINFLSLRNSVTTPQGGCALYGRTWLEKVQQMVSENGYAPHPTGASTVTYYYKGMMLVNVDSTGHFVWMRPLMHDNWFNGDFKQFTETDMVAEGNDIYVITNEAENDDDNYNPNKAARRAVMMGHGAIAAYHFAPNGTAAKSKLINGMNIIMTPLRCQGDGLYYLITGKMRGRVTEITIRP